MTTEQGFSVRRQFPQCDSLDVYERCQPREPFIDKGGSARGGCAGESVREFHQYRIKDIERLGVGQTPRTRGPRTAHSPTSAPIHDHATAAHFVTSASHSPSAPWSHE